MSYELHTAECHPGHLSLEEQVAEPLNENS
jgi:hypothetical protein